MASSTACTVTGRVAWWFKPYVHTLAFLCVVFDCEPDWAKLERVIRRAIIIRVNGRRVRN